LPNASINVLLPTPGEPVIPSRIETFFRGISFATSFSASTASLFSLLSAKVIACAKITLSPLIIPLK